MTTPKKDQRWAILPPGEPSPEDATRTRRRVRQTDGPEQAQDGLAQDESGEHAAGTAKPNDRDALSRRRARTEPELPALDQLVSEVAPAISTPRPPAFEPLGSGQLNSAIREAATAPPGAPLPDAPLLDAMPTLASPALGASLVPMPTLIDMILPDHDEAKGATILERSRVVGPSAVLPAGAVPSGDAGETLPSPPWQDDDEG